MNVVQPPIQQEVDSLYRDHHGWLQGWLRRKLGNACDAADLAHDTYVRVMVTGRVPRGDAPRRFLAQVANGLVIDLWRRQDVERAYLDAIAHLPESQAPSPETGLMIVEALMHIDKTLQRLPVLTREVFLLAQLDGLTLREISDRTGTPLMTVRRHIHKALVACMAAA